MSEPEPRASGLGSWPGEDPAQACRMVFGELGATPGLPYLPELAGRGPGGEMIGRAAALLVDLPVDLQPSGWRFVEHPGRDQTRAQAMRRADLDALAEAADGYTGELKISVSGPWTLCAAVNLGRGERSVADPGARRDVVASLTEGVAQLVGDVRRLVAGADVLVQLDEPSLPQVLAGELTTQSGFGRLRAVEAAEVVTGIQQVLAGVRQAGAVSTVVHCCAARPPIAVLRDTGADALSLDVSGLGPMMWEAIAVAVEEGRRLWAGVIPTTGKTQVVGDAVATIRRGWQAVGLPAADLAHVVVTPTCGLAGMTVPQALSATKRTVEVARALAQVAQEG